MSALIEILTTPITYVEFAMLIFIAVFIGVLVREIVRTKTDAVDLAALPLQEDVAAPEKHHE